MNTADVNMRFGFIFVLAALITLIFYFRIGNTDYKPCIKFLIQQAESLSLSYKIHYGNGNRKKPTFIATWVGSQPELPSVMLNSHMDVVPVFEEKWTHKPFAAEIDNEGRIFARGSQDMKCVGVQYLAAIRKIKEKHKQLKRTVHIVFVPDEETSDKDGMMAFVQSQDFKDLKLGFALDEGLATTDESFSIFYAERSLWQIKLNFKGPTGHGSLLHKNTAGQKLQIFLNHIMNYRSEQEQRLLSDSSLDVGDVTTVNLTEISGGVQPNVVPPLIQATFDMRIAVDVNLIDFENLLKSWCSSAGSDVEWEWIVKLDAAPACKLDESNCYWMAISQAFTEMNLNVQPHVFPGGTDIYYLRNLGIPSLGFSPMNNTPILLHDHDEFLKADTYLRGIEIYENILIALLNF